MAESAGLLIRCVGLTGTAGSNPALSAFGFLALMGNASSARLTGAVAAGRLYGQFRPIPADRRSQAGGRGFCGWSVPAAEELDDR